MKWERAKNEEKPGGAKRKRLGCLTVVLVIVIIAIVASIARCVGGDEGEKLEWPTSGLATMLPKPDSDKGDVIINDNEQLSVSVDDYTQEKFDSYVAQCQEMGFSVEAATDTDKFEAYSEDGHRLTLTFYGSLENMDIDLEAPIEMGPITWPSAGAGSLVPAPVSTTGMIDSDSSGFFYAYVGETSAEDYAAYVDACSQAGFNVDYDRGDDWYGANNAGGVSLRIEFRGFNTMTIRVDVPDGEASSEPVAEPVESDGGDPAADAATSGSADFRATMDAYEAFMNEYCDFMETYSADPNNVVAMASDYADMMGRYAEFSEQIEAVDENSLSADDLAYYTEVMGRVTARLAEVGQ